MPQNAFFSTYSRSSGQPKNDAKTLFFHPPPLSTVIFATPTVLAFVLLRYSRFNFHCYTQPEATPIQKSARKCAATSCDILRERLQSAFTLATSFAESPNRSMPAGVAQSRHAFVGCTVSTWGGRRIPVNKKQKRHQKCRSNTHCSRGTCRSDSRFPQLVV